MNNKKNILITLFALIAIGAVVFAVRLQMQVQSLKQDSGAATFSANDVQDLVSEIGKFMILPENETPTVATVSDPLVLKDQAFFAKAEKGDTVLIYATSRKAILWRPSTKKIVEVAPLNVDAAPSGSNTAQ